MIGFYDYTVILTYMSLISSIGGISLAANRHPILATFCLLFCGLCDMFDGKVARSKKNRTSEEKSFGIQIDSLSDIVAFGVLPAMLTISICNFRWYAYVISALFVLAGLIRLAYFNVTEEQRQQETDENRQNFTGLPITSSALIFPIFICVISAVCMNIGHISFFAELFKKNLPMRIAICALTGLTGLFFLLPIQIRKPRSKELWLILALGVLVAVVLLAIWMRAMALKGM